VKRAKGALRRTEGSINVIYLIDIMEERQTQPLPSPNLEESSSVAPGLAINSTARTLTEPDEDNSIRAASSACNTETVPHLTLDTTPAPSLPSLPANDTLSSLASTPSASSSSETAQQYLEAWKLVDPREWIGSLAVYLEIYRWDDQLRAPKCVYNKQVSAVPSPRLDVVTYRSCSSSSQYRHWHLQVLMTHPCLRSKFLTSWLRNAIFFPVATLRSKTQVMGRRNGALTWHNLGGTFCRLGTTWRVIDRDR
jgi:hypothetical protein